MKEISPVRIPDLSGSGKMLEDYWPAGLKLLGDMRFLDILKEYDKDDIPSSVMKRIRQMLA